MKTVTTTGLRNQFRRISAWLDSGEPVAIMKRGKLFATLIPVAKADLPSRVDFRAQRDAIWKGRKFSSVEVAEMRAAELEGEE